jgi:phosphatidylserine/phosphatidylglycerophosphate/cardiolipin synthase-like enzyme
MFVNHSYSYTPEEASQPVEVPAANLVTVWDQFLRSAVEQIDLNVFDFDLESIAQTLIEQGRKGVRVRVGIDEAESLNKRAEVQRIYQMLKASGVVDVVPVNSVGLNHQKMVAIDWENVENAKVLFSSGNLTQSCLDPEGDLKGQVPLPPNSIPNANHVITMQSWLLANLVHHELSKTLDPELKLRGAGYPMTGAYQVTGPQIERPDELLSEARPQHSLIISFTPGGGFKDINTHLIARLINEQPGPIRLVQFSFSSDVVGEALLERAQRAFHEKDEFDFLAIGDTSFAMRVESELLKISGLKLLKQKKPKKRYYVEDKAAPWFGAFNGEQWDRLRHKVFIAPPEYVSFPRSKGKGVKEPNAKIHHKVLSVGNFAIVGTSFNFSDSAQTNNEQILILHEPDIARRVDGMVRWLVARSGKTVYEEAQRRNQH